MLFWENAAPRRAEPAPPWQRQGRGRPSARTQTGRTVRVKWKRCRAATLRGPAGARDQAVTIQLDWKLEKVTFESVMLPPLASVTTAWFEALVPTE